MSKVIGIIQLKGGVAKTSTSVHLAGALASQHPELKIAVADADPQGSATLWINRSKGQIGVDVYKVASDGEGKRLKAELAEIDADIIIVDTPPGSDNVALRTAMRSDLMLVPSSPSIVDLSVTREAIETCREAIEYDERKKFLLVPSRVQHNTSSGQQIRSLLETWGPVSKATISMRIAFQESATHGLSAYQFAPESPAAQEIGLLAEEVYSILYNN